LLLCCEEPGSILLWARPAQSIQDIIQNGIIQTGIMRESFA
jgi:hypothetical protein